MPRNDIAAIIGLIVALWYVFAGPGRAEAAPRNPRALGKALVVFLVAFAITWIVLRLLDY
ncbi:MAG: hypothetical protein P4M15_10295 [Alphaproteobacteria bacterium]|nr:hypothetical protein [Alphaproteobacteria bacterium]